MASAATGPHTGRVVVTEPAVGGPWAKYELRICPTAGPASACFSRDCAPVTSGDTTCTIDGGATDLLAEKTAYTVEAVAAKADGAKSLPGSNTMTTPANG